MVRQTCEECSGKIVRKDVEFKLYGERVGLFPAEVCTRCGEELFTEETSDKIDEIAKKKGLWGLSVRTKAAALGSSIGVTIHKKIVDFMDLKKGKELTVRPETKHRLIIEVG